LPRQARARDTVDAVLAATARILVLHGYEAANTNRIAEVAGVSVGTLYQYFPGKEALVAALIERHCEQMWAMTLELTAQVVGDDVPAAARRVIDALFAAHAVEPRLHKVLHEQVPRVGKLGAMGQLTERSIELARAYLDAHHGEILPRDTRVAATVVVHTIEALAHAGLEHPADLRSGALRGETTAMVVRYLTGREG
jgi:AcrR family transcriptional regulator